ncbi:hypothetical protein P7D22_20050, partial [Lichenihabitans sp. Uapishka_5]|uniref:hypothetical protein n=1 Tax=Lichenihabitans sp. Uapishka_5 TaxID=3037302 RepID=UPI0029E7FD37
MADLSKMRRSSLGVPPPADEASPNLSAPEVAPAPEPRASQPAAALHPVERQPEAPRARRDGRTMRKTHRTIAFATRVSQDIDDKLRDIAERDGLKLVEILERALDAYEAAR